MHTHAIGRPLIRTIVQLAFAACIACAGGRGDAECKPSTLATCSRPAAEPARARLDVAGTANPREQSVLLGGGFCETGGNPSSRSLLVIFAATVAVLIAGARQHC